MLPRSRPVVSVLLPLLVVGLAVTGGSAMCNVTVDLTNVALTNVRAIVPPDCIITITGYTGPETIREECPEDQNMCTVNSGDLPLSFTSPRGAVVNVQVDSRLQAACSNYIFNVSYTALVDREFTCEPTFNDSAFTPSAIKWIRVLTRDLLNSSLNNNMPTSQSLEAFLFPPNGNVMNSTITVIPNRVVHRNVVGYYVPFVTNADGSETKLAQFFTIYSNPNIDTDDHSRSVIFGSSNAKNYDEIQCEVISFPPILIQWRIEGRGDLIESTQDTHILFEDLGNETINPFTFVGDGRVVIDEVDYSDAGLYICTIINDASGVHDDREIRLRVRNPLRPLWPALGLITSFIITAAFIIGGHFYDKWRGEKKTETEDDALFPGRHYSVTEDSESPNNSTVADRRNEHPALKRVSSGRQQLLEESSKL